MSILFWRRRKYRPPDLKPHLGQGLARFGLRLLILLVLVGFLALLAWVGWVVRCFVVDSDYFELREITIALMDDPASPAALARAERDLDTIRPDLFATLHADGLDAGNLVRFDAEAARQSIERHGKVQTARVRKRYPGRLDIEVRLRQVVALLLHDPILAVDESGAIVQSLTTRDEMATQFPYVTGLDLGRLEPGNHVESASLTTALQMILSLRAGAPDLNRKLSEVHCDREGNVTLLLQGGTEIWFGKGDPIRKMPALEAFLNSEPDQPEKSAYIDLRVDGQVYSMSKEEAARQKAAAQATP